MENPNPDDLDPADDWDAADSSWSDAWDDDDLPEPDGWDWLWF